MANPDVPGPYYPKWVGDVIVNSAEEEDALKPKEEKPKQILKPVLVKPDEAK